MGKIKQIKPRPQVRLRFTGESDLEMNRYRDGFKKGLLQGVAAGWVLGVISAFMVFPITYLFK